MEFFVPGTPVPQGRPRAFQRGGKIGMYDPATSKAWKSTVTQVAGYQRDRWHEGALVVTLKFYMPKPKAAKPFTPCTKKPDIDNLSKAVLDALNEVCYKDDSQVIALSVTKRYATGDIGVHVHIEELK